MKISISGLGYIGLPTAAILANKGYQVHGVDINPMTIEIINQGNVHIIEPDLETFVRSAVNSGCLKVSSQIDFADVFMICVPTPFQKTNQQYAPDLHYVMEAVQEIIPFLRPGNILILESTSPVGTTKKIAEQLQKAGINLNEVFLAYCPERVLPGKILTELLHNDRVVGGINPQATHKVKEFYQEFVSGKVLETNSETAEFCKLVENSYRDMGIAFANELSMLCAHFNINVWELIELANHHPRVNILQPGVGVGGHCIAVDPWFIISAAPEHSSLIKMSRTVNLQKTEYLIQELLTASKTLEKKYHIKPRLACFGLSFKADIDDLRESPAMKIVETLIAHHCQVLAVEPHITDHPTLPLYSIDEALQLADICVFLVNHRQFQHLKIPHNIQILNYAGVSLHG